MTFRENNQRITNPSGPLELLEISNESWAEPKRIANDSDDWVSQGQVYLGVPFGYRLPEDVQNGSPRMQLAMSNVGLDLTSDFESIQPGTRTMAKLIIIDRAQPDVHLHVYWLPITSVNCTPSEVSATASVDEVMRQPACRQVANPHTLPGVF